MIPPWAGPGDLFSPIADEVIYTYVWIGLLQTAGRNSDDRMLLYTQIFSAH